MFSPSGPLAALIPDYVHRPVQVEMADCVSEVIDQRINGMIEAGTGTGKTLAYLIPAMVSGKRTIVSTGTRTLQDQLYFKDLPGIVPLFSSGVRTALLKGRRNYLCPERMEKSLKVTDKHRSSALMAELTRVRQWASRTQSGDLNELADLAESSPVLPLVTSTVDNCLGSRCPWYLSCPLYNARNRALDADLIVVNHHLLFADLALKEDAAGRLLPDVDTIIVDEAHQVPEIARQFFGTRIGSGQLRELVADVRREAFLFGNDDPALLARADRFDTRTSKLEALVNERYRDQDLGNLLQREDVCQEIAAVDDALRSFIDALAAAAVRSQTFANCYSRSLQLADYFAMLTEPGECDEESVHWLDRRTNGFDIHMSPISIGNELNPHVNGGNTTWLFTSATLTVGDSFAHSKAMLGLDDTTLTRRFDSPFRYEEQVKAWLPDNLPPAGTDEHTRALVETCLPVIRANPGRTFFLFTSYRALNLAAEIMAREADMMLMVQGAMAKQALLARFVDTEHAVLLATQSFWEGVDVRGAALKCLIIDKLPFMSPEDPLSRALMSAIEKAGGNAFMDYMLPQAVISLKQGFGRLIRQETDDGLFVLGDARIARRGYGKVFRDSLSEMTWLDDCEAAVSYLRSLENRDQ